MARIRHRHQASDICKIGIYIAFQRWSDPRDSTFSTIVEYDFLLLENDLVVILLLQTFSFILTVATQFFPSDFGTGFLICLNL